MDSSNSIGPAIRHPNSGLRRGSRDSTGFGVDRILRNASDAKRREKDDWTERKSDECVEPNERMTSRFKPQPTAGAASWKGTQELSI